MANVNFKYEDAGKVEPIYFEQIYAEKPGGGLVTAPTFDAPPTTAVGKGTGSQYALIKGYRLAAAVAAADTTIKIEKGSGIVSGDFIGTGKKAVASTAVDTSNADYDTVTVTLGVDVPIGTVLYQAAAASATAAAPLITPLYVIGNGIKTGNGDQAVRLVNGANLRKETANIASEVAALLPTIQLV
ncbi:MAG: hypothetical protein LBO74_08545 [Candidatus Symbiothrix sp.]|jgi:hypothetical protein|nr:hypothetical protein [Candidatus Symbiothrix sp.]